MDIVLIVLAVIAVAVAAVLIIAALKPDTFSVQRSTRHRGGAGRDLPADQRPARAPLLVAVRSRSGHATQL